MNPSPRIKRRLQRLAALRAEGRSRSRAGQIADQVAILQRLYPGEEIRVLPEKISYVRLWDRQPAIRVVPARACLARPRFVLNEKAMTTLCVEEVGLNGGGSSSWPMWAMSSGTWHSQHETLYWRSRGVRRSTEHQRIPGLVSPSSGWILERPVAGAVFSDEHDRRFVITGVRAGVHQVLGLKGSTDSTYRAVNLVNVTVSSRCSRPRGALSYLGFVSPEELRALKDIADTGKSHGTGNYHSP